VYCVNLHKSHDYLSGLERSSKVESHSELLLDLIIKQAAVNSSGRKGEGEGERNVRPMFRGVGEKGSFVLCCGGALLEERLVVARPVELSCASKNTLYLSNSKVRSD